NPGHLIGQARHAKRGRLKRPRFFAAACEPVAGTIAADTGSIVGAGLRPAPTITCSWLRQRGGVTKPRSSFAAGHTPLHPHNKQGRNRCAPAVNPPCGRGRSETCPYN